ncbi:hypothetical protein [Leuconostoc citreum]
MVNSISALHIQGKSLGTLRYKGHETRGIDKLSVARLNVNGKSSKPLYLQPQAGFDFAEQAVGAVKVIDATVQAGVAKSNARTGAKVPVYIGTILPVADTRQDKIPDDEFDALLVTGGDMRTVGRVRSKDAFDVNNLAVYGMGSSLKQDFSNRDNLARDNDNKTIISSYYLDLVPADKKKGITEKDIVRVHVSPTVYNENPDLFDDEARVVPFGLRFAFSTVDETDWTIYADKLLPFDNKSTNTKATTSDDKSGTTAQTATKADNKEVKK